ncbi:MAG: hypothetical protein AAFP86_14070, partial [Planctomycetota bacterium]
MKLAALLAAPAALFLTDLAHSQTVRAVDTADAPPSLAPAGSASSAAVSGAAASVSSTPVSAAPASAAATRAASRAAGARPYVLLTGYWPPTNEAVRHFSPQPSLNSVWEGGDWRGRGYDVVSFFPTFTSPNCFNCGPGLGDLRVDYQCTTEDFARIVDLYEPIAIITFSRGFINMSWEVEANQYNRTSWVNDYNPPRQPDASPPDPTLDAGAIRHSTLPVHDIVDRIEASSLPLDPRICYAGDGGGFLSEYIAYLGVTHQALHSDPAQPDWCVAAGHVHVGGLVPWDVAADAVDETLEVVLDYVDGVLAAPSIDPFCPGNANSAYSEAVLTPIGDPSISTGGLSFLAQRTTPN